MSLDFGSPWHAVKRVAPVAGGLLLAIVSVPLSLYAADLANDSYQITLQPDGSVQVVASNVAPKVLRPEFSVLFCATNTGFQYAEFPYPFWYVYGGSGQRTNNPFLTGDRSTIAASQAQLISGKILWSFVPQSRFDLQAELSLPPGSADPVISYSLTSKSSGWFSAVYTGAPELSASQMEDVPQPATQYSAAPGYRFPDNPVLKQEHLAQMPLAMVSNGGENWSLIVDPASAPWRFSHQYNSMFGVGVRNEAGNAQPLIFSPMMGSPASKLTNSQTFNFALRFVARPAKWSDAYRYMARSIYGFEDQRDNSGPGSINSVISNMVQYVMDRSGSNYAMWSDEQKFNDYFTDQPGAYKLLSPLYGIGAAIMLDDEDFYRRRALPMIEYAMSREKQTFFPFPTNAVGTVETNRNLNGPNIDADSLGVLFGLSGDRSTAFRAYALLKGVSRTYASFDDVLEFYRLTRDPTDLAYAIEGANYCLANNLIGDDYSAWMEMYRETADTNYLAAADVAVRNYQPALNISPRIPEGGIVVDTNNQAPIHWHSPGRHVQWGFPPPEPMFAPEQLVPAWRPALTGLRPESYRGFTFVHYAPGMLRLSRHLNDDFTRDLARWALVGRWANYPGEIFSREYSAVYEQADFCEHPLQYMTFTSMHFGHPWMYLAWALDFLVTDTFHRSGMQIDFPNRRVRGSFPCNVYGDRPGTFYAETNVNLWLPVGLVNSTNRQINYLSAYGNGKLYLAFVNQSFLPETTLFTLSTNLVTCGLSQSAQWWSNNVLQGATLVADGSAVVQVPAKGITALAIEGVTAHTRLHPKLFDSSAVQTPASSLVRKPGAYGKTVGMFISMGRDLAEAYVYTDALPEAITSARLRYKTDGGWMQTNDFVFPFEFSIPVNHADPRFEGEFWGTRTNGQEVLISTIVLPGPPQIYVDAAATSGGDGASWETALNDISQAAHLALGGTELWVRRGEFILTNTIQFKSGRIYGGFAGTETNISQRVLSSGPGETVLRQTIAGLRVAEIVSSSNVRLDGLTLTGATNVSGGGAGLRLSQITSDVVIANCRITGNSDSAVDGGGAGMRLWSSTPTVINCEISDNYAPRTGSTGAGGVFFDSTSGGAWTNCMISGNRTEGENGGGLNIQCADGSGPLFVQCDIINNESAKNGGGVYGKGDFSFIGCRFIGNDVRAPANNSSGGGGLMAYNTGSDVLLENCVVSGNQVGSSAEIGAGGGVLVSSVKSLNLLNSIVSGNRITGSTLSRGAGVHVASSANILNVTANNCTIADNFHLVTSSAGGFNNANAVAGTVFLRNTILAYNSQLARSGTISEDHNLYQGNGVDGVPVGNPGFTGYGPGAVTGVWAMVSAAIPAPIAGRKTSTLQASGSPFVPGSLSGCLLSPKAAYKRQTLILSNSANALTVVGDMADWGVTSGDAFQIVDYRIEAGSAAIDAANVASATTSDIVGTNRAGVPDIGAYEYGVGGDMTGPFASQSVTNLTSPAWFLNFTVAYTDASGVDIDSLSNGDIRVSGTNGFNELATFVRSDTNSSGSPRKALYQVRGPQGAWSSAANGTYQVSLEPGQVRDVLGNFALGSSLGSFTAAIGANPGNFTTLFDFSRGPGLDRDWHFGERQPGNTFDDNSGTTNLIVSSSGWLTASTTNKAWLLLNDTFPDTLDAVPANSTQLSAGTNFVARTRFENFTSGTASEDIYAGILFGITSPPNAMVGSAANGFLARVDRGIGTSQVAVDRIVNGTRVANLGTSVGGFSWGTQTSPYFMELRVTSNGGVTNATVKMFLDAAIPGSGSNAFRLQDAMFGTQTNLAIVTVPLTNYAGGLLGLYMEDNASGNTSNPNNGAVRFSNFYADSSSSVIVMPPVITAIRTSGGNVEIDFSASADDPPQLFGIESAQSPLAEFSMVSPGPLAHHLGNGLFRIFMPVNQTPAYFRINRLTQ